jgi:hypothetical protein
MDGNSPPGPGLGEQVWLAGVLGNAHDAAVALANFRAGSRAQAFFSSRMLSLAGLTALNTLRHSLLVLPASVRRDLPGVEWGAWKALSGQLPPVTEDQREAVWAAMAELVPPVLMGLRRLRQHQPELFNPLATPR